ncbi:ABC transporter ATP-binding protein [Winogradskyella sp.]|uniref:ABC transporter ATP-binding protein n=1 Tax=Winogradskyella sp. TaxID=1883156 RepID=UPI002629DBDD|nr:ATP-binding cassette domain-containing protein [Winogradskyella sp.]
MITTKDLTFSYKQEAHTFSFPDIVLKEQENLLILGKSGIGKTTLLHLLAGLLKPNGGSIFIDDLDINSLSANKLDAFRGKNIGLVFQKNHAVRSLTVFKNLQARLFLSRKNIKNTVIDGLLEELDLIEYKNRRISALSEGQLQRLGIAMSVIHNPKVILADEPTSSLDDENCKIVIELLKKQAEKNNANLVVITHDHRIKSFFQNSITL